MSKIQAVVLACTIVFAAAIVTAIILPKHPTSRLTAECGVLVFLPARPLTRLRIDESAESWRAELVDAANAWNSAAGGPVVIVETAEPGEWMTFTNAFARIALEPVGRTLVVSGSVQGIAASPPTVGADDGGAWTRLRWRPSDCRVGYAAISLPDHDDRPAEVRRTILAHEIGHALGIGHSKDPRSVMYHEARAREPGTPWFDQTITADDREMARGLGR